MALASLQSCLASVLLPLACDDASQGNRSVMPRVQCRVHAARPVLDHGPDASHSKCWAEADTFASVPAGRIAACASLSDVCCCWLLRAARILHAKITFWHKKAATLCLCSTVLRTERPSPDSQSTMRVWKERFELPDSTIAPTQTPIELVDQYHDLSLIHI